jgi:hypothetical protein
MYIFRLQVKRFTGQRFRKLASMMSEKVPVSSTCRQICQDTLSLLLIGFFQCNSKFSTHFRCIIAEFKGSLQEWGSLLYKAIPKFKIHFSDVAV